MKKRFLGVVIVLLMLAAVPMCWAFGRSAEKSDTAENGKQNEETVPVALEGEELVSEETRSELSDGAKVSSTSRMVRINEELYYDTGRTSDALRCGMMDGEITSVVPGNETPTKDDQSNFGKNYGYQRWGKGQIHVNIDGEWCVFQSSEAYRLTVTNGNNGELVELERGPEFWEIIEKYNNLDVTKSENQVERTGYNYCLRLYDKDDNLMNTVTSLGREVKIDGVYYADNGYGTVNELFLILDILFEEDVPLATATQQVGTQGNDEEIDVLEDVSMHVTYATDKGANVVFTNYSDRNMEFGDDYELQMLKGEEWYLVDYIIDNAAFNDIAYMMPKDEPASVAVKWTYFHGILPTGQYRIVKEVMDFRGPGDYTKYRLAAEFEVK